MPLNRWKQEEEYYFCSIPSTEAGFPMNTEWTKFPQFSWFWHWLWSYFVLYRFSHFISKMSSTSTIAKEPKRRRTIKTEAGSGGETTTKTRTKIAISHTHDSLHQVGLLLLWLLWFWCYDGAIWACAYCRIETAAFRYERNRYQTHDPGLGSRNTLNFSVFNQHEQHHHQPCQRGYPLKHTLKMTSVCQDSNIFIIFGVVTPTGSIQVP